MSQKKISVLGSGTVGEVLADGFLKHGYSVMRASRDPAKLKDWQKKAGAKASVGTFKEAAQYSDILVLAVKGDAAESALDLCGPGLLKDKTIIDTTNPIAPSAPEKGVLKFFTDLNQSLMERLQKKVPDAHFVKAFSCVGSAFMVNPSFREGKPTMFICGNSSQAKAIVQEILAVFGWETEDMGSAEAARAIEPLCMLWCIPGFLRNDWGHAFKLLKA
jgi:predicted dinucleotide-binding enzyme